MLKAIGENIKGVFALGGRDLINRLQIFTYARRIRHIKGQISELNKKLGQESWEQGFIDTQTFPTAENLERFEDLTAEKRRRIDALDKEIGELREQRHTITTHYQDKLKEQIDLKQPVDNELAELQVEIKRIKREIKGGEHELKSMQQKIDLQNQRLEEISNKSSEGNEYLRDEIEAELKLNQRFHILKKENIELLSRNLASFSQRIDKVQGVISHYENTINEIRNDQKETLAKNRSEVHSLQQRKHELEEEIRQIKVEISPILEKLGAEVTMRRIQSEKLQEHYQKMDRLEDRLDKLRTKRDKRKRECASIGFGIKICYYGFIFAVLAAVVVTLAIVLI